MEYDDIINRASLANLMRVEPRTINVWVKQGMPKAAHGKYKLSDCFWWYIDRLSTDFGGGDLDDERTKLVIQQRERVELDNTQKRGELIKITDLKDCLNEVGVIIATQLDGLGARSAPKLSSIDDPVILQRCLLDETRHIRSAISAKFTNLASDRIAVPDSRAPTKKKRRSVGKRSKSTASRST